MKRLVLSGLVAFMSCTTAFCANARHDSHVRKAESIALGRGYTMPSEALVSALMFVESDRGATSKNILQLKRIYVRDVNRIYGTKFKYADALDYRKSVSITRLYLAYWGSIYEKGSGLECTDEVFARMHNGGPEGYKKWKTKFYWYRVKKVLRR